LAVIPKVLAAADGYEPAEAEFLPQYMRGDTLFKMELIPKNQQANQDVEDKR
jgi:hypothetical protein